MHVRNILIYTMSISLGDLTKNQNQLFWGDSDGSTVYHRVFPDYAFIWIRMHETFAEPLRFNHDPNNHATCRMKFFWCKLAFVISKPEARREWSDLSFVKLCYAWLYMPAWNKKQTSWMRAQIHSLTAGGAYGAAAVMRFVGYRCKHSSAVLLNTTLICIVWR